MKYEFVVYNFLSVKRTKRYIIKRFGICKNNAIE